MRQGEPISKVCGIYDLYPLTEDGIDGGLRKKGIYKKNYADAPLITYITVVYNRANKLKRCVESILNQKYPNIEYIIIDGKSNDGTVDIIQQFEDRIDYFISEPDLGIYDAMNKGISLAHGQFICFMNSDDCCTGENAEYIKNVYLETQADIICGQRKLTQAGKTLKEIKYPRYAIKRSVFRYIQMFHQATYAAKEVFEKVGVFRTEFSLLADWIWESKAIDEEFKVLFVDEVLAEFDYDGVSRVGIYQRDKEWVKWAKEIFPDVAIRDIEFFIYTLDRGRHLLYSLKTENKVAFRYQGDKAFLKTYYETVLCSLVELGTDISNMNGDGKYDDIISAAQKKFGVTENESIDILQITENLKKKVEESMQLDRLNYLEKLEELVKVKDMFNWVYLRTYRSKEKSVSGFRGDWVLRVGIYSLSKMCSRNVMLSRMYYPFMRFVWSHVFASKFVEN